MKNEKPKQNWNKAIGKGFNGRHKWMHICEGVGVPNLSELIEACGDEFLDLSKTDFGWIAHCLNPDFLWGKGFATPNEAVAKLWLALQKNEK